MNARTQDYFPADAFRKPDAGDDDQFYSFPRLVAHIDDKAIAALTNVYRELLPANGRILDLMSSRYSHLPDEVRFARVAATGMNAHELAANPQLTDSIVHNLNKQPTLPYADGEFDAATCAVSVQYLQQPVEVFSEVRRVLQPSGPFIVSFSNRCFPTKAVAVWSNSSDRQHMALVTRYFELAGFTGIGTRVKEGGWFGAGDPLYVVFGRA